MGCFPANRWVSQEGDTAFATVSDKLQGAIVRKKNLKPATQYMARVRSCPTDAHDEWSQWFPEAAFKTLPVEQPRMEPPTLLSHDRESITVSW